MKNKIDVFEPKLFGGSVADEIIACINESIADRGVCRVSLAGGSTPGAIYRMLGQPPRVNDVNWSKVEFFWGDERWVPKTDNQSNYKMVQETLLAHLPQPGPVVHAVNTTLGSPEEGADDYAQKIREVFKLGEGQLPAFDLMLLGCGEDGHTASIFPNSDLIHAHGPLCYAVKHPVDGSRRVTLSADAIFNARTILFIAKGEDKAEILRRVLEGNESVDLLPSKLSAQAGDRVRWLIDSLAASKLSISE
jgi:6-phosphogluconolactonase